MSLLVANEIGIFRCKFYEIKACKNPTYSMMVVAFELNLGGENKDWNTIPNKKYLLIETANTYKFGSMVQGKIYHIKMACKFQTENQRGGKTYPAGIGYEPLEVMGESKGQE